MTSYVSKVEFKKRIFRTEGLLASDGASLIPELSLLGLLSNGLQASDGASLILTGFTKGSLLLSPLEGEGAAAFLFFYFYYISLIVVFPEMTVVREGVRQAPSKVCSHAPIKTY